MQNLLTMQKELHEYAGKTLTFMEVCGTHTAAISESGIPGMLSKEIRLISGPGCPVCVTVAAYVDRIVELSMKENTSIVTYGDLIRVKGTSLSLKEASAYGADVIMVYAPTDILQLAMENPDRTYIFAAIGFETNTPVFALILEEAIRLHIHNIRLLTALKTMPPMIEKICQENKEIDGIIAPGHISVITGSHIYEPIASKYKIPFVVAGFEDHEIVSALHTLLKVHNTTSIMNLYDDVITENGNQNAQHLVNKYFEPCDAAWRGMGIIPGSGMAIRSEYSMYDAGSRNLTRDSEEMTLCACKDVITGKKRPPECMLYQEYCTPENPKGPCMVSLEGSCFNYYMNRRV